MPDNKSLMSPLGRSRTTLGSGVMIGDGVMLTAGHVWLEFNERDSPQDRAIRELNGGAFWDPRGYYNKYKGYVDNLPASLPTIPANANPDLSFSGYFIERHITSDDIVFVNRSGDVGKNDAGLVLYIDSSDITKQDFGLTNGSEYRRWGANTGEKEVPSGQVSLDSVGVRINYRQALTEPGDSGGANWIVFEGNEYIFGNNVSTKIPDYSSSTIISEFEFYQINYLLQINGQHNNVTFSEPTNLIVGSGAGDTINGTFRADVSLGRGGVDEISDGDGEGHWAWADDQLFGGGGDDTLRAGQGDDLLHGGDFRAYGTDPRLSLDADGDDTVEYQTSSMHVLTKQGLTLLISATAPANNPRWNFGTETDVSHAVTVTDSVTDSLYSLGTDTLISIETIKLTDVADTFAIQSLGEAFLAGANGQGGVAVVNMGGASRCDAYGRRRCYL